MSHFTYDQDAFRASYPEKPFMMRHDMADHPLFTLEAMAELAAALPSDKVEYNRALIPREVKLEEIEKNGLSPADTVREIETCGSWMVLQSIERVPAYAAILEELLDEAAHGAGVAPSDWHHRSAFCFVTSPGGMTPFHLDPECNFLLQVRGSKTMTIVPHKDHLTAEELEIYPSKSRYLEYREGYDDTAMKYTLHPGDALLVPFNDPHYVENGPEVSISLSITYHSRESWRVRNASHMNHLLRRIGMPQAMPGVHPGLDRLKAAAFETAIAATDPIRKNEKARQFVKRHVLGGAAAVAR